MKKLHLQILVTLLIVALVSTFGLTGCFSKAIERAAESIVAESMAAESAAAAETSSQERAVPETTAEPVAETAEVVPAYELTGQDWVILTQPSVCFVTCYYSGYVYDPNRLDYFGPYYSWIYGGTGFCINSNTGHIITAAHVVDIPEVDIKWKMLDDYIFEEYPDDYWNLTNEDWNWIYENYEVVGELSDTSTDHEVWVQFNTATSGLADSANAQYLRAEVIDFSPWDQRDIAILKIQSTTGGALSAAMLGDSTMAEIQDELTIIGFPWTSEVGQDNVMNPTITMGRISGKIMIGGTEVLQVQGDAREGSSGGPVLNAGGMVIGMLTMATDETNNYLRPVNDIKEMLARNGIENKTGMVDEEFKQGLMNFRMGNYQDAINNFNAVLNLNQRHLLAQEYRSKAQSGAN
jgi:S1-C subfamily serine protease